MFENLYIHVPFCSSKCGYCAFYSLPQEPLATMQSYVEGIERELGEFSRGETLSSVYIGGGTPTILPLPLLEDLLSTVQSSYRLAPGAEVSIECNPDTVSPLYIDLMRAVINRVSLGVQSFSPRMRKVLGRRGGVDEIDTAIKIIRRGGIENIGLDLIYAIPGQKLGDWLADLHRAADSGVKHLSCYSLTIEEGTALAREVGLKAVDEELSAEMWQATGAFLQDYGLERYEVSNYALSGWECRYNMNVWHGRSYLGLGPAASSFDGLRRWSEPADLEQWLKGTATIPDDLTPERRAREILAFGLRTAAGWRREQWNALAPRLLKTLPWAQLQDLPELQELASQELVEVTPEAVVPTVKGMAFWDNVAEKLI